MRITYFAFIPVIFCDMLSELEELDESRAWPRLFQRLNWEASQKAGTLTVARLPENRQLNRYRDVLPYDHSRIILKEESPDYINANLVEISRLNKKYILTQGPLPHTAKHFWQMIWEQRTAAVVMLNRVIEKNQIKCYQYWPSGEAYGHVDHLEFGNFRIYYLHELRNEYFTIRSLELENILTDEKRPIYHFHYRTWPDFGVPTSPATFLAFLFEVRKTGVLSVDVGPCVVHCSAGIGRSGTFIMVDSVLAEVERMGDMNQIDIKAMLLEMRQYRVGLIQTPDQLRFTYLAILEGVQVLMPEIYQRAENQHFHLQTNAESGNKDSEAAVYDRGDKEDAKNEEETPPPLPPRRRLEAADEPDAKKSRIGDHEPEAEKEVFSDSSDGSDEIINLSSLSESESEDEDESIQRKTSLDDPKEDFNNKLLEEMGGKNVEKSKEPSLVQAELQLTEEGVQPTDEGFQHREEGVQPTVEGYQHREEGVQPTVEGYQHREEGVQPTDEGCQHREEGVQPTDEGCQHREEGVQPTDEGCQHREEGLQPTYEGGQHREEGLQPTYEGGQHREEGIQPTVEGCQHREEIVQQTNEGSQHREEGLQQTSEGEIEGKESILQLRKRRREERKQKITDLVENIKKNVKREEDTKVWKSRLKNTLIVVAVCSVAYITFRYFTSG